MAAPAPAQPLDTKAAIRAAQVQGEATYYYDGARRVKITLALDELANDTTGDDAGTTQGVMRISHASPDRRTLEARAGVMQQAMGRNLRAVFYAAGATERTAASRRILTNEIALKPTTGKTIEELAAKYNLTIIERPSYAPGAAIVRPRGDRALFAALDAANTIYEAGDAEFATPLFLRRQTPRLIPNDTLFGDQWHLRNTGQAAGLVAGNDVNVTTAWDNYDGAGVNIAITDDGLQTAHPDLSANVRTDIDWDFNGNDDDPNPSGTNNHGTACAGVASARGNNSLGVSGGSREAGLVGLRLIAAGVTDATEANAMNWQVAPVNATDRVHVNSNSWGPSDSGAVVEGPGPLTKAAFINATTNGRGGRGTIFTWAAGNGRQSNDNINADGYANSRYTVAVGASGGDGTVSYYSEFGSPMLVNTPSNFTGGAITTTDRTG